MKTLGCVCIECNPVSNTVTQHLCRRELISSSGLYASAGSVIHHWSRQTIRRYQRLDVFLDFRMFSSPSINALCCYLVHFFLILVLFATDFKICQMQNVSALCVIWVNLDNGNSDFSKLKKNTLPSRNAFKINFCMTDRGSTLFITNHWFSTMCRFGHDKVMHMCIIPYLLPVWGVPSADKHCEWDIFFGYSLICTDSKVDQPFKVWGLPRICSAIDSLIASIWSREHSWLQIDCSPQFCQNVHALLKKLSRSSRVCYIPGQIVQITHVLTIRLQLRISIWVLILDFSDMLL